MTSCITLREGSNVLVFLGERCLTSNPEASLMRKLERSSLWSLLRIEQVNIDFTQFIVMEDKCQQRAEQKDSYLSVKTFLKIYHSEDSRLSTLTREIANVLANFIHG